jgi:membrane associated rhomboid family serine protease
LPLITSYSSSSGSSTGLDAPQLLRLSYLLLSSNQSSLSSLLDFLPLVLYHVLVPPVSYLEGCDTHFEYPPGSGRVHSLEALYRCLSLPRCLQDVTFVRDLTCFHSADNKILANVPKVFLSSLVHDDYTHAAEHTWQCLSFGSAVQEHMGAKGLYTVFLGGCAGSSLPALLHSMVDSSNSNSNSSSGAMVRRHAASFARELSSVPASLGFGGSSSRGRGRGRRVVGSAGGVGALLGCSAVLLAAEALRLVQPTLSPLYYRQQQDRSDQLSSVHTDMRSRRSRLLLSSLDLALKALPVAQALLALAAESGQCSGSESGSGSGASESKDSAEYTAQVRGCAFGALAGMCWLLPSYSSWFGTGSAVGTYATDWPGVGRRVGGRH